MYKLNTINQKKLCADALNNYFKISNYFLDNGVWKMLLSLSFKHRKKTSVYLLYGQ